MSRVKEIREQHKEKKLLQEYNRRKELVALRDNHSPEFSNWRGNVTEGMNTSNVFVTTLPSTGEASLETIDTDTSDSFSSAGGDAAFQHSAVVGSGSGIGDDGGFNIGSHLTFNGDGAPRWSILNPIDSSKFDTLVINAIRGNDNNGGEDPDVEGEELRLYYLPPGGSTFRSITRNQDNQLVLSADSDIIIGLGSNDDGLRDYSITLPSYARGEGFSYMLYQQTNSGTGFDNYGVKNVRYKRRAPLSVFLPLNSPEAVSFINDGSGGLTPEEKKKRLEDMLAASDEYIETQFPENKIITDRVKSEIEKNIASTDRQTFDDAQKALTYDETVPERTQLEILTATYRQELEQKGLKPGEFGAVEFFDWFREQPDFVEPSSDQVNFKNFDPKSYQPGQKSSQVQFWSDPSKLAKNKDIQKLYDKDEFTLDEAINNITSVMDRIPGWKRNKEDDSYFDGDPRQKKAVYEWASKRQKVPMEGDVRIGLYSSYPAEDYYDFLTEFNSYEWAERMVKKHHPNLYPGDEWTREYVYYLHIQSYANMHEERGGARYYSIWGDYDDALVGYHTEVRQLYELSKYENLTGAAAVRYNAIIDYIQPIMTQMHPSNITGKGALFGDNRADYYWGTYVPEPVDKTLPGFLNTILDDEELVSNFSGSEQTQLKDLAFKFSKAEEFVGYDPNADLDPYYTLGSAAVNYSVPIAKSILTNRPIVIDPDTIPEQYIRTMAAGITPMMFQGSSAFPRDIPIVNSPVAYADENIFVGSNGKVQSNIGPKGQKAYYKKNNTMQPFKDIGGINVFNKKVPVFGHGNALAAQGQAQYQMVVPKDGSEPYLYYMDHAYHNLQSTDPGEVPDLGKTLISGAVHTIRDIMQMASGKTRKTSAGQSINDAPNTGGMAGYPPNIRGDVITHVKIPMSQLSPDVQKIIKSEYIKIGLGGTKALEKDDINPFEIIDPITGRLGSYGVDSTTAATASGSQKKKNKKNKKKKEDEIAQAGPGYRPRPGDDAAGNKERLGTDKKWDPHMKIWAPNIPKASNSGTMVAHYEPKGKTLSEKRIRKMFEPDLKKPYMPEPEPNTKYERKARHNDQVSKITGRLKSPDEFFNQDDIKPTFPQDDPPQQINGRHPDLVDGEKISNRFNKLDPISAKAMPKTGNPKIDAKVAKARKKTK